MILSRVYFAVSKVTTLFYLCSCLHHSQMWPLLTQQQQILGCLSQHTEQQKASHSAELSSVQKADVFPFHFHQQGQQDLLAGAAKGAAAPKAPRTHLHHRLAGEHTRGCFRRAEPQLQSLWQPGPNTQVQGWVVTQAHWFCAGTPKPAQAALTALDCSRADISQEHLFPWGPAEGRNDALVFVGFFFLNHHPHLSQLHSSARDRERRKGKAQPAKPSNGSEAQLD